MSACLGEAEGGRERDSGENGNATREKDGREAGEGVLGLLLPFPPSPASALAQAPPDLDSPAGILLTSVK